MEGVEDSVMCRETHRSFRQIQTTHTGKDRTEQNISPLRLDKTHKDN